MRSLFFCFIILLCGCCDYVVSGTPVYTIEEVNGQYEYVPFMQLGSTYEVSVVRYLNKNGYVMVTPYGDGTIKWIIKKEDLIE